MGTYDPRKDGALCQFCPLAKNGTPAGNSTPPEDAAALAGKKFRLVVVGEAPGKLEENIGRPFVGRTGKLLEHLLAEEAGLKREDCYLTNAAACRGETDDENELAAECCAPRLHRELVAIAPDVPILSLGTAALRSTLGLGSILVARGFIFRAEAPSTESIRAARRAQAKDLGNAAKFIRVTTLEGRAALAGRVVLPTLHPAFVLRADTWKPVLQADLRRFGRLVRGQIDLEKTIDRGAFEVVPDVAPLYKLGPEISFDIETDGLSTTDCNIRTVQLSDGARTFVLFPWKPALAEPLTAFLESRRLVVGHNTRTFDEVVCHFHGLDVRSPKINWADSLIAYHSYASHLRMGMDHVASMYLDLGPWKLDHGKRAGAEEKGGSAVERMTADELFEYGAADARIEKPMWDAMQPDLRTERAVYDHDMQLAALCRDMQIDGIGFDEPRRRDLSVALGREAEELVCKMRKTVGKPTFSPTKLAEVRGALFSKLRAPKLYKTPRGDFSTNSLTLEALATLETSAGEFARDLLRWRVVTKIKSTYVDAPKLAASTRRVHYAWKPFGTVSGRLACRLQSAARYDASDNAARVRELYIPSEGHTFVYFDVSQAEMRLAAYLSGDPTFIAACAGDVHANNAKACFRSIADRGWLESGKKCALCAEETKRAEAGLPVEGHRDGCTNPKSNPAMGKPFRDLAKNIGFAISYLAETDKVFATIKAKPEGKDVTRAVVDNMLTALRRAYRVYFAWVEANLQDCRRRGHMRSPFLGRIRWLGYFPKVTEVANFPIQSGLADVVNARMIELAPRLPAGATLAAQIHDACLYDCPQGAATRLEGLIKEVWAQPVKTKGGELVLPIDMKRGARWSELG